MYSSAENDRTVSSYSFPINVMFVLTAL